MATSILPPKFDRGDIVVWLGEFDACALANGWKDEDKIKKLPAFLRGRAATHFYATPVAERATLDAATKKLKQALCPLVEKEKTIMLNLKPECFTLVKTHRFITTSRKNRLQPHCRSQICSFGLVELYTRQTFGSQPHTNLKRDAEFCPPLSSDRRPRRPCTYERSNIQVDNGHEPTRGFNDRTGNSTESARRPSDHFSAVICHSD